MGLRAFLGKRTRRKAENLALPALGDERTTALPHINESLRPQLRKRFSDDGAADGKPLAELPLAGQLSAGLEMTVTYLFNQPGGNAADHLTIAVRGFPIGGPN